MDENGTSISVRWWLVPMTQSDAELLLAEQLRQAGIPFEQEYRFHPERKWRADFYFARSEQWIPNAIVRFSKLLVEIDGGGFVAGRHSRGMGVQNDCEKQSAAAILGYRVIRCTPRQVSDGTALHWIQQALRISTVS